MKFIKFSFWMSAFGSLVMLGLNFSNPGNGGFSKQFMSQPRAQARTAAPLQKAKAPPKKWVRIEGKIYEYNPKNVYNVNGVSTYYKPSKQEEQSMAASVEQQVQQAANAAGLQGNVNAQPSAGGANLERVRKMADKGPLSAYTPGGMQAIMDGAVEAKAKAEERNRALNQLMNE